MKCIKYLSLILLIFSFSCIDVTKNNIGGKGESCYEDNSCDEGLKCSSGNCINVCDGVACSGFGKCIIDDELNPKCKCDQYYKSDGLKCIMDEYNPCKDLNCKNNSTCKIESKKAICVCSVGYVGSNCKKCEEGYQDNNNDGTCSVGCTLVTQDELNCLSNNHTHCDDSSGTVKCMCDTSYVMDTSDKCVLKCNPTCGLNSSCQILANATAVCICNDGTFDVNKSGNCCPDNQYYDSTSNSCIKACNNPSPDTLTEMTNNNSSKRAVVLLEADNIVTYHNLDNLAADINSCGSFVSDWYKVILESGTYATIKVVTSNNNDAILELFDSNLNYKTKVDFYSEGTEALTIGGAGIFYIKISSYEGNSVYNLLKYSLYVKKGVTRITNNFLYIYGSQKNWREAKDFCVNHNSNLIKIEISEENRVIKEFITEETWIGLNDIDKEAYCDNISNDWKWSDGTNSNYKNWAEGEPSNGHLCSFNLDNDEDCVIMYSNGEWGDNKCNQEKRFICEYLLIN